MPTQKVVAFQDLPPPPPPITAPLPPPPPIAFSTRTQHGPISPFSIGAEVRAVNANGIYGQSMLIVVSVVPGGPCDRAGVCAGDTLLEAENENVQSLDSLATLMLAHARKSMINIRVRRASGAVERLTLWRTPHHAAESCLDAHVPCNSSAPPQASNHPHQPAEGARGVHSTKHTGSASPKKAPLRDRTNIEFIEGWLSNTTERGNSSRSQSNKRASSNRLPPPPSTSPPSPNPHDLNQSSAHASNQVTQIASPPQGGSSTRSVEVSQLRGLLRKSCEAIGELKEQLASAHAENLEMQKACADKSKEMEEANAALEADRDRLQKEHADLKQRMTAAGRRHEALSAEVLSLRKQRDTLTKRISELEQQQKQQASAPAPRVDSAVQTLPQTQPKEHDREDDLRALVEDLKTALIDKDAKMARMEEERSSLRSDQDGPRRGTSASRLEKDLRRLVVAAKANEVTAAKREQLLEELRKDRTTLAERLKDAEDRTSKPDKTQAEKAAATLAQLHAVQAQLEAARRQLAEETAGHAAEVKMLRAALRDVQESVSRQRDENAALIKILHDPAQQDVPPGDHSACEERARKLRTIAEQAVSAAGGRDVALQKERDRAARLAKRCAMLEAKLTEIGIHDHGEVDTQVDLAPMREHEVRKGDDGEVLTSEDGRTHDVHAGEVERGRSHHMHSSDGRRRRSSGRSGSSSSSSRRSSSRESRHEEVAEAAPIDTNQEFFI